MNVGLVSHSQNNNNYHSKWDRYFNNLDFFLINFFLMHIFLLSFFLAISLTFPAHDSIFFLFNFYLSLSSLYLSHSSLDQMFIRSYLNLHMFEYTYQNNIWHTHILFSIYFYKFSRIAYKQASVSYNHEVECVLFKGMIQLIPELKLVL